MNINLADAGAAAGIVGALVAIDAWRRNRHLDRQDAALKDQDNKLEEIHVLVNSRLTEALERIIMLEDALSRATGIPKELIEKKDPTP